MSEYITYLRNCRIYKHKELIVITSDKLLQKLYKQWFSWKDREDYSQFLHLTNFEHCSDKEKTIKQQEEEYFSALIKEFEEIGGWKKLKV